MFNDRLTTDMSSYDFERSDLFDVKVIGTRSKRKIIREDFSTFRYLLLDLRNGLKIEGFFIGFFLIVYYLKGLENIEFLIVCVTVAMINKKKLTVVIKIRINRRIKRIGEYK